MEKDSQLSPSEADETHVRTGLWGETEIGTEPERELRNRPSSGTWLATFIDAQVNSIERTIALGGMAIATTGLAIALFVAVAGSWRLGVPLAVLGVFTFGYFVSIRQILKDRPDLAGIRWVSPLVEQLFPFAVSLVIVATQGAAYALGSWVPPILCVAMTVLNVLRLRPVVAVVMGLVSSGLFAVVQFVAVPVLDPAPLPASELYSVKMALARCLTLALTGACAAWAASALRGAISTGAERIRSAELFGKYRLGKEIAVGGMGSIIEAVYAPEGGFERPVAIKRIHTHLASDPRFVNAFRAEAELCARLGHPNIVQVLDFGRAHGTYFFAMEFVDGANLAQLIERARSVGRLFPARLVAQIGVEIGEALHFAHAVVRGSDGKRLRIVHRDLNPRNVLVARTGEVKLTDFGIARTLRDAAAHETRHLMGSLAYLAPEQARGEALDQRSDLFAFGLLLFELLTLESVFERPTDVAVLRAVVEDPIPDVTDLRGDLHEGWRRILRRALERDPSRRIQSAERFISALKAQLEVEGVPGPDELKDFVAGLMKLPAPSEHETEKVTRAARPRAGEKPPERKPKRVRNTTEVQARDIHALPTMVGEVERD